MVDAEIKEENKVNTQLADQTEDQKPAPPIEDEQTEIDLHELQIKLEKVRSYLKRTEMRINGNEMNLERLRKKQQEIEDKKMAVTLLPRRNKTENKV